MNINAPDICLSSIWHFQNDKSNKSMYAAYAIKSIKKKIWEQRGDCLPVVHFFFSFYASKKYGTAKSHPQK